MVYQARTRKRIFGIQLHRGPDGSAFQKCDTCGASVAIALADMHQCEPRKDVKKLKCQPRSRSIVKEQMFIDQPRSRSIVKEQMFIDQPRSAFRIFMDDFVKKNIDGNEFELDKRGFETWKNMTLEEKFLYFMKAETINLAHLKLLRKEENDMPWRVDDEADSADVGNYDEVYSFASQFPPDLRNLPEYFSNLNHNYFAHIIELLSSCYKNYEDHDYYDSESSGDLIDFGLRQTRGLTPVRGRVCFHGGLVYNRAD